MMLTTREPRPFDTMFFLAQSVTLMVVIEVLFCAGTLFFANKWQRQLLSEPVTPAALVDAPPAVQHIAKGRFGAFGLFAAAAILSIAVTFLFVMPIYSIGQFTFAMALGPLMGCGSSIGECLANDNIRFFYVYPLVGFLVAFPLAFVARALGAMARSRTRRDATVAMLADNQSLIVFLRALRDDQVELPKPRQTPLRLLFGTLRGRPPLDHLLIEEFVNYGPVVAIGRPGEATPPFGAWRTYVDNTDAERWKIEVAELTSRASAVILVVDDTVGVSWEIEHLASGGHIPKTIFLAPPRFSSAEANTALWSGLMRKVGIEMRPEGAQQRDPILAMFVTQAGARLACSETFTRSEYLIALRWFFRARSAL